MLTLRHYIIARFLLRFLLVFTTPFRRCHFFADYFRRVASSSPLRLLSLLFFAFFELVAADCFRYCPFAGCIFAAIFQLTGCPHCHVAIGCSRFQIRHVVSLSPLSLGFFQIAFFAIVGRLFGFLRHAVALFFVCHIA